MIKIDQDDTDINNLTAIVYSSVHAMLIKDKLDPIQLAIAMTCASKMLLMDFVEHSIHIFPTHFSFGHLKNSRFLL